MDRFDDSFPRSDSSGTGTTGPESRSPEAEYEDRSRWEDRQWGGSRRGERGDAETDLRRRAVDRLHARRNLVMSLAVYVVVNGMLVVFWARNGGGFFWPFFPIAFWGIGLLWQVLGVFGGGVSEDRIQAEMRRLGGEGR